jgi:hypothetical protein
MESTNIFLLANVPRQVQNGSLIGGIGILDASLKAKIVVEGWPKKYNMRPANYRGNNISGA